MTFEGLCRVAAKQFWHESKSIAHVAEHVGWPFFAYFAYFAKHMSLFAYFFNAIF
jgi:hypothetical protein